MVEEEWRHPIKVRKTEDSTKRGKNRAPSLDRADVQGRPKIPKAVGGLEETPILAAGLVAILAVRTVGLVETPILAVGLVAILAVRIVDLEETPILAAPVVMLRDEVVRPEEIPILADPEETPILVAVLVAILMAEVGEANAVTLSRTRSLAGKNLNTK